MNFLNALMFNSILYRLNVVWPFEPYHITDNNYFWQLKVFWFFLLSLIYSYVSSIILFFK